METQRFDLNTVTSPIDRMVIKALLETDESVSKIKKRLHLGSNGRVYNIGYRYLGKAFFDTRHETLVQNRGMKHLNAVREQATVAEATTADDQVTLVHAEIAPKQSSATVPRLIQAQDPCSVISENIRRRFGDLVGNTAQGQQWLDVQLPEGSAASCSDYASLKEDAIAILAGTSGAVEFLPDGETYAAPDRITLLSTRILLCLVLFSAIPVHSLFKIVYGGKGSYSTLIRKMHTAIDGFLPASFIKTRGLQIAGRSLHPMQAVACAGSSITQYRSESLRAIQPQSAIQKPLALTQVRTQPKPPAGECVPVKRQEALPLEVKVGGFTLSFAVESTIEEVTAAIMGYVRERYHV